MERQWINGWCWRCEAPGVPVLWVGPVQTLEHGTAPLYYCRRCISRLEALIVAHHQD